MDFDTCILASSMGSYEPTGRLWMKKRPCQSCPLEDTLDILWVLTGRGSLGAGRCTGDHSCRSRESGGELGSKLTMANRRMIHRGAQVPTKVVGYRGVRRRRGRVSNVGARRFWSEIISKRLEGDEDRGMFGGMGREEERERESTCLG